MEIIPGPYPALDAEALKEPILSIGAIPSKKSVATKTIQIIYPDHLLLSKKMPRHDIKIRMTASGIQM